MFSYCGTRTISAVAYRGYATTLLRQKL